MRVYNPLLIDIRAARYRMTSCGSKIVVPRSFLSVFVCFGIIACGTVMWQADAFSASQKGSSLSSIKPSNTEIPRADSWNRGGKVLAEVESLMESSTTGIRYRSVDQLPDDLDDSTTGETWSSGDHVSPTFDESTARNITTQLGQTAYLHCIVNNLSDKTVSWIRRKDFHVLTVGLDIYTSDDRFQAIHIHNTNDWALQIKFAQLRDEGIYECQVSSDPKISYFVNLTVLVAKAVIEGSPDIYVKSGSSINLTCVITQSPIPPVFVFWYHDERMINYDSSRGQIAVQKGGGDTAVSKLYIKDVQPTDSGNYTCCPSNAEATSITVHVLNGEKPAAMQHDANPGHSLSSPFHPHYVVHWLILILWLIVR